MTTGEMLLSAWHWKPEVLAGCGTLAVVYLARAGAAPLWRRLSFLLGLLLLALSLVSPLDALAHEYLFAAHMLQHLVMIVAVPPLLLWGVTPQLARLAASGGHVGGAVRSLGNPLLAWGLATVVMLAWHLPSLYGAALASDGIHVVQHAMFLGTSIMFWWPVVAPQDSPARLAAWASMVYLFAGMVAGTVLGVLLTFAPAGLYPHYLHPEDHHGLLALVREGWGISAADDQQIGGMLMWIGGGLVYGLAIVGVLARWLAEPDEDEVVRSVAPSREEVLRPRGEAGVARAAGGAARTK